MLSFLKVPPQNFISDLRLWSGLFQPLCFASMCGIAVLLHDPIWAKL